ncbi:MAG: DUF6807 family protein [Gemmataceae bacterium]
MSLVALLLVAAADPIAFREGDGSVEVTVAGEPFATYVYRDPKIPRPYFTHVFAPGGGRVTRNHPPQAGDPTDHAELHPGIWLSFGILNETDFWRNKAVTEQVGFAEHPKVVSDVGTLTVRNRYATKDGKAIATEAASYSIRSTPSGIVLVWDATLSPAGDNLVFGDQEEMGLGIRLATLLTVKNGGAISGSAGGPAEKQVRGKQHSWCDYSGTAAGRRLGVLIVPDPANFRPSWFHARDYGLIAANPFARKSLGGGEPSRVVVKAGETLRLRFAILVHGGPAAESFDPASAARAMTKLLGTR